MDFSHLKYNLKKDYSAFPILDIALISNSSIQLLKNSIKGYAYEFQLNINVHEYIANDIYNQHSLLNSKSFHNIILFLSPEKFLEEFYRLNADERKVFASNKLSFYKKVIQQYTQTSLIIYNLREMNEGVWGNYANKNSESFLYQLRKINLGLMQLAQEFSHCYIQDMAITQARLTNTSFSDSKLYITADMTVAIDALPIIAKETLDIIQRTRGLVYKCLVVDLDNTLWGGIVGDIGVEQIEIGSLGIGKAFTVFQLWIKELKKRGILLAVCSKNDEATAVEALLHPEMILRRNDFVSFKVNWNNKADNLREIQQALNIGMESIVFIDDSIFERNLVRKELPEVFVPELPDDPAEFVSYMAGLNLFETSSFTGNDLDRTQQYREETDRIKKQNEFTKYEDYLKSLEMKASVNGLNAFTIPRISQLALRSNQFNLRTIRYSEAELFTISASTDYLSYAISLKDTYGDYGLIAFAVLKKENSQIFFIENIVMSCRVFQRGVEDFLLNHIIENISKTGITQLTGEHIPTQKNDIVKDFYKRAGFEKQGDLWKLQLQDYKYLKQYINE